MRARKAVAVVTMMAAFTGCAAMRDNPNMCKAVTTGTGALLGATAGGLISGVAANHGDESEGSTNWEIGLSTAGGALGGGLIGFLLGHALCPEPAPPVVKAPPPPPPPPAPTTKLATIRGANFDFNKSKLTAEGRSNVAAAAATLKQHP